MFVVVANCITNRRFFVDNRIDMAKPRVWRPRLCKSWSRTTTTERDEYRDAALEKRSGAFPNGAAPYLVIAEVKKTGGLMRFVGGNCAVLSYLLNRLMTYSTPA